MLNLQSFHIASTKYGVSKLIIQRKVNENMLKVYRPNALTNVDKENLVKEICLSSKLDFPFISFDIVYWFRIF